MEHLLTANVGPMLSGRRLKKELFGATLWIQPHSAESATIKMYASKQLEE